MQNIHPVHRRLPTGTIDIFPSKPFCHCLLNAIKRYDGHASIASSLAFDQSNKSISSGSAPAKWWRLKDSWENIRARLWTPSLLDLCSSQFPWTGTPTQPLMQALFTFQGQVFSTREKASESMHLPNAAVGAIIATGAVKFVS